VGGWRLAGSRVRFACCYLAQLAQQGSIAFIVTVAARMC
jgi:hypothetical protein